MPDNGTIELAGALNGALDLDGELNGTVEVPKEGEDGYSPTIEVTTIEGGHQVAVTDVNGTTTFDVMDGMDSVFYAEYGVTTSAEISAAYRAGKTVAVKKYDDQFHALCVIYPMTYYVTGTRQLFAGYPGTSTNLLTAIWCIEDEWSISYIDLDDFAKLEAIGDVREWRSVWQYHAGELTYYQGKVYKFIADHLGTWDENDVVPFVVMDEISGKYTLPSGGIPATDLASAVQTSLGKADTAYQKPSGGIPASDIASGVIPDSTSDLTNDSGFITASDIPVEIVWAKTAVTVPPTATTSAELEAAYQAGKLVLLNQGGKIYYLSKRDNSTTHYFDALGLTNKREYYRCKEDAWQGYSVTPPKDIPSGGTTGQYLAKASGTDYDTEWVENNDRVFVCESGDGTKFSDIQAAAEAGKLCFRKRVATNIYPSYSKVDYFLLTYYDPTLTSLKFWNICGAYDTGICTAIKTNNDGIAWGYTEYHMGRKNAEVPEGGAAGQVLAKASSSVWDLEWVDQSGGGGLPAGGEPGQVLAMGDDDAEWKTPTFGIEESSAVGTALVGTAKTDTPNYTPSGSVALNVALAYSYDSTNRKLIFTGVTGAGTFTGNGVKFKHGFEEA